MKVEPGSSLSPDTGSSVLDRGLPGLQNCEKQTCVVSTTQSLYSGITAYTDKDGGLLEKTFSLVRNYRQGELSSLPLDMAGS